MCVDTVFDLHQSSGTLHHHQAPHSGHASGGGIHRAPVVTPITLANGSEEGALYTTGTQSVHRLQDQQHGRHSEPIQVTHIM